VRFAVTRHTRGSITGQDGTDEGGGALRRLGRLLRYVLARQMSHITHHTSHITHHTSHITHLTSHITHHTSHISHHTSHVIPCSDDKVAWEVKRYRLEGTTLLEFSTSDPDEITRVISLEGVVLFKHVGAKVGLAAAAPCICLESLGLAASNARLQLKKVG
jgi:hypothetical protein